MSPEQLRNIVEAALLAADQPLGLEQLAALFPEEAQPPRNDLRAALDALTEACAGRGVELRQVGSGWRYQVRAEMAPWVLRLWEERPPRYSRALLETLALIAYRQPITRGEIEEIRGVSVSSNIVKTLLEREWVRVVGHRDVPGRPAMYATTRQFLDYFSLTSLEDLPPLAAIRDLDSISAELELPLDDGTLAAGAVLPDTEEDDVVVEPVADAVELPESADEVALSSETETETEAAAEPADVHNPESESDESRHE